MKKLTVLSVFLLSVVSLLAGQMTAEEVIAKYLKAIGGEKNLKAVKSVMMQGTTFAQGMSLQMRTYVVLPKKAYFEVLMGDMVISSGGTNGVDAWQQSPMGTFYLEGDLKEKIMKQAELFHLLDYKKQGIRVAYVGEELAKGKKAHRILAVTEKTDTISYWFDAETCYLIKAASPAGVKEMLQYKKVGDVVFSHKIKTAAPEGELVITFDSIAVNIEMSDSLFIMPKNAKPMPDLSKPAVESKGK